MFCKLDSQEHTKIFEKDYSSCDDLQILFAMMCDRTFRFDTIEQEFLRNELTDFLCLSSWVFLRSCSCDLQYSKPVFSSKDHKLAP